VDRNSATSLSNIVVASEGDMDAAVRKKKERSDKRFDRLFIVSPNEKRYMPASLVCVTLPHSRINEQEFVRRNGARTLTMLASKDIGLPYGVIPRLLLIWLCSEAAKTKSRHLVLGDSLSSFMRELDMIPTGGRWGSIKRLREQADRLFSTAIRCTDERTGSTERKWISIADSDTLWWDQKSPKQRTLFENTVTLSEAFFKEVINKRVPFDMNTLKKLKKSPLAIDLYLWLTYRMSYMQRPTTIPWGALQIQFGANYPLTAVGRGAFKHNFLRTLKSVEIAYPALIGNVNDAGKHILIRPVESHIPKCA
jgi:hypothetical protein